MQKGCLCSKPLLGLFAFVQWSHRDKIKQQIHTWNLLVLRKYKGNEWILWLSTDGDYLSLAKRTAQHKISALNLQIQPKVAFIRRGVEIYNIINFLGVIVEESQNKITARVIKWFVFHKAVMNVYLICAKVENQPLDRKENNTKIRDKRTHRKGDLRLFKSWNKATY